jgi:hypothetical protein
MKLLVVISLIALTILVIITRQFPQVGASLPVVGAISAGISETGATTVPGKLLDTGRDLGTIVKEHELGGWHLAAIVLGALIARKLLMWLLR